MLPEALLKRTGQGIKIEWRICIGTVFILGFLAHGYRFSNNLPNWDALLNEYHSQNMVQFGRVFLSPACGISSYYELPWLNGLLSFCYIAAIAVMVCELLEFKKDCSLILVSGLLVTFPAVTSTFTYMYTADGYFLAALCMTAAVLLTLKKQRGWIPASLLICFGLGIYQAYIAWAVVLFLLAGIHQLLFKESPVKKTLAFLGKGLCAGAAGSVLYYGIITLLLQLGTFHLDNEYQGISGIYSLSNLDIVYSLKQCVERFLEFFAGNGERVNLYVVLNLLMLMLLVIFTVRAVWRSRIWCRPSAFALLLALGGLIPAGCFVLYLIGPNIDYHMLMCYGVCSVYLYFMLLFEHGGDTGRRETCFREWSTVVITALIVLNFVVIANVSYHILEMSYEKSVSTVTRMADRIEQMPGMEKCREIAVLGRAEDSEAYSVNFPPDMTGITEGLVIRENFNVLAMLQDYGGITLEEAKEEKKQELLQSQAYEEMGSWPQMDSVRVIDGTVVIKLG